METKAPQTTPLAAARVGFKPNGLPPSLLHPHPTTVSTSTAHTVNGFLWDLLTDEAVHIHSLSDGSGDSGLDTERSHIPESASSDE